MRKYIYCLLSVILFAQIAAAKVDCDKQINDYFDPNYFYEGGPSAAAKLAIQRRCLKGRNPIYSDAHEFEQKQEYFLSIDDSFLVRKNLIDYQEAAEILDKKGNIEESSKYVDKFNDILVKRYDKILAAKILLEQVQSGHISKNHQEELFVKLDGYLPKLEKCNPGICDGWGLISLAAGAFPKCKENSCQKNITYENLYFALAEPTNNLPKAARTIEKLLAKDFGTPKSNGEVKAPLMMALYIADYKKFLEESKNFLNEAQKTIKYDYQDAILLPLITQLMIANGNAINLLPYTQTKHNNVAGLEATLALLSSVRLGQGKRQELRADLETYYELTSACEDYRYEEYNGEKFLRAGTPATLTQNTELDLFLRQRIQAAYWVNDYGGLMKNKATNYWCSPVLDPEGINTAFASAQIAKQFIKEAIIDDVVLLPLFAFNKIKEVIQGMRKTPHLRISYYNGERVSEVARNTHRLEVEMEQYLENLDEMPYYLEEVVGQDFLTYRYYITDPHMHTVTASKTRTREHIPPYRDKKHQNLKKSIREQEEQSTYIEGTKHPEGNYHYDYFKKPKRVRMHIDEKIGEFLQNADPWMQYIGYENTKKIAKIMGVKWEDLKSIIKDNEIKYILQTGNLDITNSVIRRLERLYYKHYFRIKSHPKSRFTIAYLSKDGKYNGLFDSSNIFLVESVDKEDFAVNEVLKLPKESKYLSKKNLFSPKNPRNTFEVYVNLLECTPATPCTAIFVDGGKYFKMFSVDGKKMIRVTPHEYSLKDVPKYHFHYYELYGDRAINYHIRLDVRDPFNNIFKKSPEEIKELLMPEQFITSNPSIIKVSRVYNYVNPNTKIPPLKF